ncbi:5-methyltetrahydropteroyltriglutamate--homocysteine S-methyltransferase [Paenibacillus sp.]|uniref:5-methyltetrahydropteroyltriglutamate-- homocysteine S-methyltransferase n=1 Tax=Paenibacillus sp. TaxID=58172 RepID=UPI002D613756|nr:5-methyltetrahydropteroyltriglutamate--homocysteine S-methyltransferase [Paenibacillus sp.]HZG58696.1 5-methyltetrahydropteroyltriglutamate--homocysteine S-methyltransferase [Paenibacillus sp.]
MQTSVVGYPRIGERRELKFASERYFRGELSKEELLEAASRLRETHWREQRERGIDYIPSNDFSLYDGVLDLACLLNLVPRRYRELGLDPLETYYAMARGYQGEGGDAKALPMKKWFNTNYHYLVPEVEAAADVRLVGTKPFDEFEEARRLGIETKPTLVGAFTLLKLANVAEGASPAHFAEGIARAYGDILERFGRLGAAWVQFDEPALVTDLTEADLALFRALYERILPAKGTVKVLAQTYFGDVRDAYEDLLALPFDGVGLDFVEGRKSLELLERHGFPDGKTLFAGVVNGKNVWRNSYEDTVRLLNRLRRSANDVVLSASCSLLHVPYTVEKEGELGDARRSRLAFAKEKLRELAELGRLVEQPDPTTSEAYLENAALFAAPRGGANEAVRAKTAALAEADFARSPAFAERRAIQKEKLALPPLPTTTIGSFPQTADVRAARAAAKRGSVSEAEYEAFLREKIAACVALQEELGLDVLVHGEFERNDMVEYFGERLDGFLFTEQGWVQSYGTRCVKPPIVWGDVSRPGPITVEYAVYAQRLTRKPVKGMLTGPVTILNWSFPREDVPLQETAFQLALAIREEVLELEANGIGIIQIDEAALREKLPLRASDWRSEYLDWAIPAFRLTHSGVQPSTQIHTHMCYSEFADMIRDIDDMDADVITLEASRSALAVLEPLRGSGFRTEVGPGVYDIHSPRVPGVEELREVILSLAERIDPSKLWVNPDCGLKTRGEKEVRAALRNMVAAAREARRLL